MWFSIKKNYWSYLFHEYVVINQRTLIFKKKLFGTDWLCGGLIHFNLPDSDIPNSQLNILSPIGNIMANRGYFLLVVYRYD